MDTIPVPTARNMEMLEAAINLGKKHGLDVSQMGYRATDGSIKTFADLSELEIAKAKFLETQGKGSMDNAFESTSQQRYIATDGGIKTFSELSDLEKAKAKSLETQEKGSTDDASQSTSHQLCRHCDSCDMCENKLPKDVNFKICSRCKTRRYCSIQCQKTDWKTHKQSCSPTASSAPAANASIPKLPKTFASLPIKHAPGCECDCDSESEDEDVDDDDDYSSDTSSQGNFDTILDICTTCKKSRSQLPAGQSLKACAKCQITRYCSKECQKKDWPTHKPNCASKTNIPSFGYSQSREGQMINQMMAVDLLHDVPQFLCYQHLIDIYRLRLDEEYRYSGHKRGIYKGDLSERSTLDPLPDFRRFLDNAEKRPGLLPPWWSKQRREECEGLGNESEWLGWDGNNIQWRGWCDLRVPLNSEILGKQYENWMMPMIFQQIAEKIEGTKAMALGVSAEEMNNAFTFSYPPDDE